ncbi:homocysteine S-methyltransferase family protein [Paraburkholderia sp. SARCC-3016]|uniref:homocysteine S-methyltransferase family protein n=1 Tax=Paraburkholderia sp. SARCC-3016 TaxID=3058611 RepID=UPI0028074E92|nr:homocysteine S-methyltransferase family protein [Paraburkholderia sp. SARCC-3016]MDQ7980669.1 homocysteine S-methyltransferase family protein [Paraburkholderia sp. SARCC-3016]
MSQYRSCLPLLDPDRLFLASGGLETSLVFHEGIDLPHFASFTLLKDDAGTVLIEQHFDRLGALARDRETGLMLSTPTWRANRDWGRKLGYSERALDEANRLAVDLLLRQRAKWQTPKTPVVISGTIGPRGDGYQADMRMSVDAARDYHRTQIETFAATQADLAGGNTLTYIDEAIGMALAARACAMPIFLSFTVETDGRLPSGETLRDAIERTDAETGSYASFFMINCAHPTHFKSTLQAGGDWVQRIRGLRANASRRSHAELNEALKLDDGDPIDLGEQYKELDGFFQRPMSIVGGCCGTDVRHVEQICRAIQRMGHA